MVPTGRLEEFPKLAKRGVRTPTNQTDMACRGVHFAVSSDQANALLATHGDEALRALLEQVEEAWDADNLAESDKAWDALHRCLTDGQLQNGNGSYPLSHCVLGPRQLHKADGYIVSLVLPTEVRDVAKALESLSLEWFRERYLNVLPKDYAPEYGAEDLEYTWSNLEEVRRCEGRRRIRTRCPRPHLRTQDAAGNLADFA